MTESVSFRAVVYTRTGGPEVLRLIQKQVSAPGPGEVRVRIHRSGVNPTDWKSRRGATKGGAVSPAQVPNQDGAGVVDAVGPGVEEALVGSRVWIREAAYHRPEAPAQECALVPTPNPPASPLRPCPRPPSGSSPPLRGPRPQVCGTGVSPCPGGRFWRVILWGSAFVVACLV